ncbi:MAG: transporter [Desulfovibrio sp.]
MDLLLLCLPLLLIIALLFMRQHMLVAGLAGGVLTMLIGGLSIGGATGIFLGGMKQMLSIIVPILYAAAAAMVARAGSVQAIVELAQRYLKGRIAILAGVFVLIQAGATYMAGMGAGNTMVIAPLVAAAVGCIPGVVAGMAIATAACFTTSPASTETAIAAKAAATDLALHASNMLPYTILFVLGGAVLAAWSVWRKGAIVNTPDGVEAPEASMSLGKLWITALPALLLLFLVVGGNFLNALIGVKLFTPMTIIIVTAGAVVACSKLSMTETCEALTDGARFILTTLFAVGIFLGMINLMAEIGTFKEIAGLASTVSPAFVLPVAILIGFGVAFPAGAFCAGVLTLILPTLSNLGMPSEAMGFVAIATGLGTQISPVQINVAALGQGFDLPIMGVVRANLPYVLSALAVLMVLAITVV